MWASFHENFFTIIFLYYVKPESYSSFEDKGVGKKEKETNNAFNKLPVDQDGRCKSKS